MAARGTFKLTEPDKINMTLTMTMSVAEWRVVQARLKPHESNGEWYFDDSISQMLEQANKHFHFYENPIKPKEE